MPKEIIKTSLSQRAAVLSEKAKQVHNSQATATLCSDLQARIKDLQAIDAELLTVVWAVHTLGKCPSLPKKDADELTKTFQEHLNHHAKDAIAITRVHGLQKEIIRSKISLLQTAVHELWRHRVSPDSRIVAIFQFAGEDAAMLRAKCVELDKFAQTLPTQPKDLERAEKLREQCEAAAAKLSADGLDESVIDFLRKVHSGDVLLSELMKNTSVLKWLQVGQRASRYRISAKPGQN